MDLLRRGERLLTLARCADVVALGLNDMVGVSDGLDVLLDDVGLRARDCDRAILRDARRLVAGDALRIVAQDLERSVRPDAAHHVVLRDDSHVFLRLQVQDLLVRCVVRDETVRASGCVSGEREGKTWETLLMDPDMLCDSNELVELREFEASAEVSKLTRRSRAATLSAGQVRVMAFLRHK